MATRTKRRPPRPRAPHEGLRRPLPAARLGDLDPRQAGRDGRGLRRGEGGPGGMGERGVDGLLPLRRQAAPDGADARSFGGSRSRAPGCRNGCARRAIRTSAISPRRCRCSCPRASGRRGLARLWMRERLLPLPALDEEERYRAAEAWVARAAAGSAARLLQADHRRAARRRVAAAGREGARRSRRRRGEPHGAADDRLRPGAADAERRRFRRARRRRRSRRGRGARRGPALSLLSRAVLAAPARGHGRGRSGRRRTGSSNGSSTASARSSSGAARAGACGRAARS